MNSENRSGGVCLFIRNYIYDDFKVTLCNEHCNDCKTICNSLDSILWCIIGDILFVVIHIPPESSPYINNDILTILFA